MKRLLLLTLVLSLPACTLRTPEVSDWAKQRENVRLLAEWEMRGRMAVKVENDPEASGQVSVKWLQLDEVSKIRLSGPLGAGALLLIWEPERVSVSNNDGEKTLEYKGPGAAERFISQELGWAFPADSIRYWVRCLSAPSVAPDSTRRGEKGELVSFNQYGWRIDCARYGEFDGYVLPTRITMEGRGVRLRLAVSDWRLPLVVSDLRLSPAATAQR